MGIPPVFAAEGRPDVTSATESYIRHSFSFDINCLNTDENAEISVCREENSAVGWLKLSEIAEKSTEKWMIENIYNKTAVWYNEMK